MQGEPVVTAATIVTLINAVVVFARLMGWLALNDEQFTQLMLIVGIISTMGAGFIVRNKVTPVSDPRAQNTQGEIVDLVPEDGSELPE